ncbi:DUF7619 domain-containing protein [Pontibacter amylolyticus]|uniref:DUF7619 domain-containing protein n=1 Tax=Pontibacter amylolyticus TaxID=1424080 RepID=UPI0016681179|nr:IPT/TIG domain-containing protein [Pontibacter amylolyticus]
MGTEYLDYAPEGLNKENYGSYDIALDQHNNLYAVSYTYSKVAKFSPEGKLLLEFGNVGEAPGQFRFPEDIAVNSKDEIYVADTGNRRIQKFDKTGKLLQVIPLDPTNGNYFEAPLSIDFDSDNNLYLLHNPENKVVKYSPDGKKLIEFGQAVGDTLLMINPWKLAVDKRNNQVYVTDLELEGFYRFNLEGGLESVMSHKRSSYLNGTMMSIAIGAVDEIIFIADRRENNESQILMFNGMGGEGMYEWGNLWQNEDLHIDNEGNVYLLDEIGRITKFNEWGEFVMTFGNIGEWSANLPNIVIKYPRAITSDLFNNLYVLRSPGLPRDTTVIYKLDQNGKILGVYDDLLPSTNTYTDLAVDAAGNMYVADLTAGLIHKISPDSRYLGTIGSPGFGPGQLWMPLALAIDNTGILHVLDYNGGRVQQFDARGKLIRQFGKFSQNDGGPISKSDLALDSKGNIHVASNMAQRRYWVFNSKGDLLHEVLDNKVNRIALDRLGANLVLDDDQADGYSLYTADAYETPQSIITGVVYNDVNNNCMFDEGERTLSGIVVATNPGPYFAITDQNGSYTLTVTPAEYTLHTMLSQQAGKTITATCPAPEKGYPVTISDPGQLIQNINFGNYVFAPAHLSVSVSSTRRRRCFESTTTVRYENSGFATAPDAKVYLQLPKEMGLLSADKSYTRLADGTYEFKVGDLAGGQSGTITIQDIVTCGDESVRGLTVCTRAWITPSNNKPAEPTPTVSITGRCHAETGMIRFVVRNTGTADMDQHELFRKFANGELASQEQFRLAAGDSLVLWVPSLGYTWRLEADQPDGNGDNSAVSVTIEGCPGEASSSVSTGMVNLLPSDDEEAEKSAECMPITDSYDPNDKLVTPVGRTEEFYTPTNTALKYKVRFQNTGTDVAYRIVVVDTLSEHLDLSTLQLGATSHPSRVEVSGKGRPVLTWTFDNIMLPDSTADEPGSHGYILFSIKPKAGLPEKTLVENFADIFFDFNSPIRTNITQNRIYDMPPVINESVRVHLEDVLATPGIAGFSPSAGKFGTEVTITGQRFAVKPGESKVYLNGKAATVVSATATELKVLVPTGTATGNLKVITPDGGVTSADKFEVYQPPVLSSFSPAEGMVGQTVTLSGEHLQAELIEEIRLGNLTCEILSSQGNTLTVRVPAAAATGKFQISTKGGEALSSAAYTVWYAPGITGLSKQTDIVGARVTIMGEHFATDKARNQVRFGQALAEVLEASPQQLTVRVPEGAASGFISVETPGGKATATTTFEVIPGPKFTAMQPASGTVGTVVEITGEHFGIMGQQDKIVFNGQVALVLESTGDRYRVRVPRGASTGKVTITGYGGKAHSSSDFVVEELAPAEAVTVYPNPSNGQFTVSLRHADFDVQLIEVYDALGKRLHQTHIPGPRPETVEISLPTAKAGLYFLQIQTERGMITKKLTVL